VNLPRLLDQKSAAEYLSLPAAVVGRMATGRVLIDGYRFKGVRFECNRCKRSRDVSIEVVIADLKRRQVGGGWTRIGEVGKFARLPCEGCGAVDFVSVPWWD